MKFKKLGRMLSICALAGVAAVASTGLLTGCNNGHSEAEITIEYDGQSYVLEYTLYRNMYPQTVKHFIELADSRFYDNTIIHDCQSSYWYGGGYSYLNGNPEADETSYTQSYADGNLLSYMESASKARDYASLANSGKLTPSVYGDLRGGELVDPYTTLIGEFSTNQHKIDNGALKNSYGALKFYYESISSDEGKKHVYLDKQGSDLGVMGEYRYNSATSLFSIQTGTSTSSDSTHCIFATLNNTDTLKDLRTAVTKSYDSTDVKVYVFDELLGTNKIEGKYKLKKKPIIVKSVRITKY